MAEQIPSCIEQQRPSFPSASNTILTVGANKRKIAFLPIRSRSLTNECPDQRAVRRNRFAPSDYDRLSSAQVYSYSGLIPSRSSIERRAGILPPWQAPP